MKQKIQEIIGTQWVENGRVKKNLKALKEGKCTPCRSKAGNICCNQMKTTAIFKRQQTSKNCCYFTIQSVRQNKPFISWSE